jgi:hypothetical protein
VILRGLGNPASNERLEKYVLSPQSRGTTAGYGKTIQKTQRVADKVLAHQVKARVEQSAEPFEEALRTVLEFEAGRQLGESYATARMAMRGRTSGR